MSLISPAAIKNPAATIENADSTNIKDLLTAGSSGSRIDSISVVSTDSADKDIILYLNDGTTDFQLGRVTIKAGSGSNGTDKPVSMLTQAEFPGLKDDLSYYLQSGYKLRVAAQAAVTAGTKLIITAVVGDY